MQIARIRPDVVEEVVANGTKAIALLRQHLKQVEGGQVAASLLLGQLFQSHLGRLRVMSCNQGQS